MDHQCIMGLILAGGASRRFGADKRHALLDGRSLIEWVIERARPQVGDLLVNTNQLNIDRQAASLECLSDDAPGEGPIAGVLAGLAAAGSRGFTHLASFACDTPFFPTDTVAHLAAALRASTADYAVASCGTIAHRIFALWNVQCRSRLGHAFTKGARSMREVEHWLEPTWADFPDGGGPNGDPFFNINTPAELETAQQWLVAQRGATKY
jgi:molybdopterin-guanine dinucleotide biosynthesis protein A